MRTKEMVLIAPFLKTSNFYLPAYLYIYYLCRSDIYSEALVQINGVQIDIDSKVLLN